MQFIWRTYATYGRAVEVARRGSFLARLGRSGCAWVIPAAFAVGLFLPTDQGLIALCVLVLSFALPLMCLCLLLALWSAESPRERVILVMLSCIHLGLFVYLVWNSAMIWQYWLE